jgi:hypothetical protein
MSIQIYTVAYQVYLLPYIKITHDITLYGSYEVIIGWFNKELVIAF